jgi:hypothetical protein
MPLRGHKAHLRRLRKLSGEAPVRLVSRALFSGAEDIAVEAQISITTGAISGKGHIASKPGEPPNNDTGDLANNIEALQPKPLEARVQSSSDHAMIEFDWGNVAARPYLRPARDKLLPEVVAKVERALDIAVKQSRSRE